MNARTMAKPDDTDDASLRLLAERFSVQVGILQTLDGPSHRRPNQEFELSVKRGFLSDRGSGR